MKTETCASRSLPESRTPQLLWELGERNLRFPKELKKILCEGISEQASQQKFMVEINSPCPSQQYHPLLPATLPPIVLPPMASCEHEEKVVLLVFRLFQDSPIFKLLMFAPIQHFTLCSAFHLVCIPKIDRVALPVLRQDTLNRTCLALISLL